MTRGVEWFLSAEDFALGSSRSGLGKQGATRVQWRFGSYARRVVVVDRAVVVGHDQALLA